MRFLITLAFCLPCFGAAEFAVGSFTANAGTGSQIAVNTLTFQPILVILRYNNKTSDGSAAEAATGFGACVSSSQRTTAMSRATDNTAVSNGDRILSNSLVLTVINSAATTIFSADCTSLNSNGFTINIGVADGVQRIINYEAFGGSDITNAKVGSYTASGSPQDITGVGFDPDVVFLFFANASAGTAAAFTAGYGVTTSNGSWSWSTSTQDNQAAAVAKRLQKSGKSLVVLSSTGVLNTECTGALITDGFRQTCSTQGNLLTQYVAMKGGLWKVGTITQPASTGSQAVTGVGITPKLVEIATYCTTSQTSVQANNRASIGAGTSSSARFVLWHGDTDAAPDMITSQNLDRANIVKCGTEAGASPTFTNATADLTSLGNDTITLNWTQADGTQRELLYLAAGDTVATTAGSARQRMVTQ